MSKLGKPLPILPNYYTVCDDYASNSYILETYADKRYGQYFPLTD